MPAITAPSSCDHSSPRMVPTVWDARCTATLASPQQTLAPRPRRIPRSMGAVENTGTGVVC